MTTRKFAADDANLNTGSIITSRTRKYIDIDLAFERNPSTDDVFRKRDANAVKEAVKHLILTNFYERPFQPFIGSNVYAMLFELADDVTSVELKEGIRNAIQAFEPRARILSIMVNSNTDQNSLDVTLEFQVVSTQETVRLQLTLDRLR